MIYSFDIFDTVISRKVGSPCGVFCAMAEDLRRNGRNLVPGAIINRFCDFRVEAERIAHVSCPADEISLDMVYDRLKEIVPVLTPESIDLMKNLEIETEVRLSFAVPDTLERIRQLQESGERVILLSDMYLSHDTIKRMLHHASPLLAKLPLYLSSDFQAAKWSGKLYKIVAEQEHCSPEEIVHVGDNYDVDVLMAQEIVCMQQFM